MKFSVDTEIMILIIKIKKRTWVIKKFKKSKRVIQIDLLNLRMNKRVSTVFSKSFYKNKSPE